MSKIDPDDSDFHDYAPVVTGMMFKRLPKLRHDADEILAFVMCYVQKIEQGEYRARDWQSGTFETRPSVSVTLVDGLGAYVGSDFIDAIMQARQAMQGYDIAALRYLHRQLEDIEL